MQPGHRDESPAFPVDPFVERFYLRILQRGEVRVKSYHRIKFEQLLRLGELGQQLFCLLVSPRVAGLKEDGELDGFVTVQDRPSEHVLPRGPAGQEQHSRLAVHDVYPRALLIVFLDQFLLVRRDPDGVEEPAGLHHHLSEGDGDRFAVLLEHEFAGFQQFGLCIGRARSADEFDVERPADVSDSLHIGREWERVLRVGMRRRLQLGKLKVLGTLRAAQRHSMHLDGTLGRELNGRLGGQARVEAAVREEDEPGDGCTRLTLNQAGEGFAQPSLVGHGLE